MVSIGGNGFGYTKVPRGLLIEEDFCGADSAKGIFTEFQFTEFQIAFSIIDCRAALGRHASQDAILKLLEEKGLVVEDMWKTLRNSKAGILAQQDGIFLLFADLTFEGFKPRSHALVFAAKKRHLIDSDFIFELYGKMSPAKRSTGRKEAGQVFNDMFPLAQDSFISDVYKVTK